MNDCLFCKIVNNEIKSYTVYEDNTFKVILDVNPISNGHMLIIPKKHILNCQDIDDETFSKMNNIIKNMHLLLENKLHINGLKLVQNNGIAQEVKHYHMHLTPVYNEKQNKENIEIIYNKLK
jgi:histidine triad (HIT) family protein